MMTSGISGEVSISRASGGSVSKVCSRRDASNSWTQKFMLLTFYDVWMVDTQHTHGYKEPKKENKL